MFKFYKVIEQYRKLLANVPIASRVYRTTEYLLTFLTVSPHCNNPQIVKEYDYIPVYYTQMRIYRYIFIVSYTH